MLFFIGGERGILPLCNIDKFFAARWRLDISRVAAAASRLPSSALGGGRRRDPRGRSASPPSQPNKKTPRMECFFIWRRKRDLNPRGS